MGANSKIEWCDHTFNPWIGCTKVSPGFQHCYAEAQANRFTPGNWGPQGGRKKMSEAYWKKPLMWTRQKWVECFRCKWRGEDLFMQTLNRIVTTWHCPECDGIQIYPARQRVFCGSMCDVFEDHGDLVEARSRLWQLIEATPNLDWLLLTKRPENVERFVPWGTWERRWPKNVWMGTSVEDQERANERIPELLKVPARVRFLSCEPLLGAVNIERALCTCPWPEDAMQTRHLLRCQADIRRPGIAQKWPIHWVIAGGESGPQARPMHPEWVRGLRDQCVAAGVPFFFKQWGEWGPAGRPRPRHLEDQPDLLERLGKKVNGRVLDGREWSEYPKP